MVFVVESPTLWFTVWIEDELRNRYGSIILHEFRRNVMVNIHHLIKNNVKQKLKKILPKFKKFMLDSGGFTKRYGQLNPEKYLGCIKTLEPDVVLSLDMPILPSDTENIIRSKLIYNAKTSYFLQKKLCNENIIVMPVVHGLNIATVKLSLKFMEKFNVDLNFFAIGSLVSLIRHRIPRGHYKLIDIIHYLRKLHKHSYIHVLGVGGTTTMHLMFFAGVNSIDSAGWEKKAGYGVIQLPGIGDRFLRLKAHGRKTLNKNEFKLLLQCSCPICTKYKNDISKLIRILDSKRDFRAVHNAWVFNEEYEKAKKLIKIGLKQYEKYVMENLRSGMYRKLFIYLKVKNSNLDLCQYF